MIEENTQKRHTGRLRERNGNQLSLFGEPEMPDAFKKAVQVVHSKPKAPLSLLQRKLGNAWLKHAIEHAPDAMGWWELSIKQLALSIGFDSHNRQYLKDAAEALMRIIFEWDVMAPLDKRVHWKASVLFPEVEIRHDSIRYQISAQMREKMIHPEIYAMIDMNVVRRFRRAPSLAIWEFCIRFERIGRTAEVQWEMFRDMVLGESTEQLTYREYKYFKSKVLNPAIAEINLTTAHRIDLQEARCGKRVTTLRFTISRQETGKGQGTEEEAGPMALTQMLALGVPPSEAERLGKRHHRSQIETALAFTSQRKMDTRLTPLDNPAAYFRQALAQRYQLPTVTSILRPPSRVPMETAREAQRQSMVHTAQAHFHELAPEAQNLLIEAYNDQQTAAALRWSAPPSPLARAGFFLWLATQFDADRKLTM